MEESAKASLLDILNIYLCRVLCHKFHTAPGEASSLVILYFHLVLANMEEEEAGESSRAK